MNILNLAGGEFYTASELLELVAKNEIGFYIGKLIGDAASILTGLNLMNIGGEMAASGVVLIASGGGAGGRIVVTAGGVVITGESFARTVSGGVDFVISMDGLAKSIVYTSQGKGAASGEKGDSGTSPSGEK